MRLFLLLIPIFLLSACVTSQAPAPATHYGAKDGVGSAGAHIVLAGDTLYSVSQRYKIPLQNIVIDNGLTAPFTLEVGERIQLPPPQEYKVKAGDTLYSISRLFDVTTSQLAKQNELRSPYRLYEGQTLRLSSLSGTTKKAQPSYTSSNTRTASVRPSSKPKARPVKTKITAQTPKRSSGKFMRPVNGRVVSSYGPKKNGLHNDGINLKAPRGAPVRAAENGVVVYTGNELKGSGNLVLVRHEGRWMTAYAHMDKIIAKRGQVIKRGQTLGTVGSTGSVDTPQLHFEVRRGTKAINPERYLDG